MRLQAAALGRLHCALPIDGMVQHALRHGANQAFVDDLTKGNAIWRNTLSVDGQTGPVGEVDFLIKRLPRRANR